MHVSRTKDTLTRRAKQSLWLMIALVLTMIAIPSYLTFSDVLVLSKWQVISGGFVLVLASGVNTSCSRSVAMAAVLTGLCGNILVNSLFSENLHAITIAFTGFIVGLTAGGYLVSVVVESEDNKRHLPVS